MYWSNYSQDDLLRWAAQAAQRSTPNVWIIFDNTAAGHATDNALQLRRLLNTGLNTGRVSNVERRPKVKRRSTGGSSSRERN
jgi:uncharacterized protein YecE (DUF72 family)